MASLRTSGGRTDFENIVILTGAGISRESGLDTFRDSDGIWAKVNLEDVATPGAFARNPALVNGFYNARRRQLLSGAVHPNEAHLALSNLKRLWKGEVTIVTQNIDDLHERAGSLSVIHIHGKLLTARCTRCQSLSPCIADICVDTSCSACTASGTMRPDVVWFGEMPMHMDTVQEALENADLFISVGTSGTVYPAAGFVEIARSAGAHTVELNLEHSAGARLFDDGIYGPATKVVKEYVAELLLARSGS
jgi:NAD-dependent deacetylase